MYLILFGKPGSGKGTQGALLKERFNVPHISTGDIFREAIKTGTPLGTQAKAFMDRGELVTDDIVTGIVKERIEKSDCQSGFILDGFPRTVNQAQALDVVMKEKGKKITAVLNYSISQQEAARRLLARISCASCGALYNLINTPPAVEMVCDRCRNPLIRRGDDTEEVVNNRLKVYESQTAPVMDYYETKGVLLDIKAEAPVEAIFREVEGKLAAR